MKREKTTDYSYADGSSGTITKVYSTEDPAITSEVETSFHDEEESSEEQEIPSADPVSLAADPSTEETQSDTVASDL